LLDFDQPMGVLLVAVLHFVEDADEVSDIVATLRSALAPGSHLVVSHSTIDGLVFDERVWEKTQQQYRQQTTTPLVPRKKSDVVRFFDGFEMVEPGLVWLNKWRPDPDMVDEFEDKPEHSNFYVGIGRLP
jgi:hypothetical protein